MKPAFVSAICFCLLSFGVIQAQPSRAQNDQYIAGLIDDGLFEAAIALLKSRPMEGDEQAAQAFLSMSKIYAALGNPVAARQALREAESLDANNPRLIIERARVETIAGNLGRARRALEEARAAKTADGLDRVEIQLIESRIELALGKESAARAALSKIPGNERLVLEESKIMLEQGDLTAARTVLTRFLGANPGSGRSLVMLARVSEIANERAAAEMFYRRAAAQFSKSDDKPREEWVAKALARLAEPKVVRPQVPEKPVETIPEVLTERDRPKAKGAPNPWILRDSEVVRPSQPSAPTIVAKAFPYRPDARLYTGSGVVVDGGRRVVTNRHVIENATNFYVRNSLGDLSAAKVERVSKTDDLAVLVLTTAFPGERSVTPAQLGEARTGATIAVIGFPLTDVLGSMTPSITNGIVIKITGMGDSPDSFQVSAKMNKGNSGGAVFDTYGRLVGIAVGKLDTVKMLQGSGFLPEDINFAIHTERLKVVGLPVASAPRPSREMSLEDLYQQSIGSVVLVAGEAK